MRKGKVLKVLTFLTLIIFAITLYVVPVSANKVFDDLSPVHWCYDKIIDFEKKGYVDGYEDGTFRPDKTITRAEFVKIVNNFFGYELENEAKTEFVDVSEDDWFMPYVNEAVERGYIEGYEDDTFRPEEPIRRQEATVILARILDIDEEVYPADHVDGLAQYSDGDEVQDWARVAIHSYSVYNFINGYEDGSLRILQNVTRAETVELLNTLEEKLEIDDDDDDGGGKVTPRVKQPTIALLRESIVGDTVSYVGIKLTVDGWINADEAARNLESQELGAYMNITSTTKKATIHESLLPNAVEREYLTTAIDAYDNISFVGDGVYEVSAYATRAGYRKSPTATKEIKVDTTLPTVTGEVVATSTGTNIAHVQKIEVKVTDPQKVGVNAISGLNKDSVRYAWFKLDGNDFIRVTGWTSLNLNSGDEATVVAPAEYGEYKLGVSAADNAENEYGKLTDVIRSESGEIIEEVEYDFVEETDEEDEDIVVVVGNNAPNAKDLVLYTVAGAPISGAIEAKDPDGDPLSYVISENPTTGEATMSGDVTTFVSDKAGNFEYTVTITDAFGGETTVKVTVVVYDITVTENDEEESGEGSGEVDLVTEGLEIYVGESKDIEVEVVPEASGEKYEWTIEDGTDEISIPENSDDPTVIVSGEKPGEAEITVVVTVPTESGEVEVEKTIVVKVISRVTVTIPSDSKVYDGTALTAANVKAEKGLTIEGVVAEGDVLDVDVSGEIVNAGTAPAERSGELVAKNMVGEDVSEYYEATFVSGILEIKAASINSGDEDYKDSISVNEPSDVVYDGETHKM